MARLYSNENFPLPVVEKLRKLGHDVITIQETGKSGQSLSDEAVLTLNRKHFIRLHKGRQSHNGIIVCSFDPEFEGQAQRIHEIIGDQSQLSGNLIRVNRPIK